MRKLARFWKFSNFNIFSAAGQRYKIETFEIQKTNISFASKQYLKVIFPWL